MGAVRVMIGERCRGVEARLEGDEVEGEPHGSGVLGRPRSRTGVVEVEGETVALRGGVPVAIGKLLPCELKPRLGLG